jgi:hypothetical protein
MFKTNGSTYSLVENWLEPLGQMAGTRNGKALYVTNSANTNTIIWETDGVTSTPLVTWSDPVKAMGDGYGQVFYQTYGGHEGVEWKYNGSSSEKLAEWYYTAKAMSGIDNDKGAFGVWSSQEGILYTINDSSIGFVANWLYDFDVMSGGEGVTYWGTTNGILYKYDAGGIAMIDNYLGDFQAMGFVTPEPATMLILGIGSMFVLRRKKA